MLATKLTCENRRDFRAPVDAQHLPHGLALLTCGELDLSRAGLQHVICTVTLKPHTLTSQIKPVLPYTACPNTSIGTHRLLLRGNRLDFSSRTFHLSTARISCTVTSPIPISRNPYPASLLGFRVREQVRSSDLGLVLDDQDAVKVPSRMNQGLGEYYGKTQAHDTEGPFVSWSDVHPDNYNQSVLCALPDDCVQHLVVSRALAKGDFLFNIRSQPNRNQPLGPREGPQVSPVWDIISGGGSTKPLGSGRKCTWRFPRHSLCFPSFLAPSFAVRSLADLWGLNLQVTIFWFQPCLGSCCATPYTLVYWQAATTRGSVHQILACSTLLHWDNEKGGVVWPRIPSSSSPYCVKPCKYKLHNHRLAHGPPRSGLRPLRQQSASASC